MRGEKRRYIQFFLFFKGFEGQEGRSRERRVKFVNKMFCQKVSETKKNRTCFNGTSVVSKESSGL